jgi:hypothetical protein
VMSGALALTTTHFTQFALFGEGKHKVYIPLASAHNSMGSSMLSHHSHSETTCGSCPSGDCPSHTNLHGWTGRGKIEHQSGR